MNAKNKSLLVIYGLLLNSSCTYVTTGIACLVGAADLDAAVGAGMDESKCIAHWVNIYYNTYMTNVATRTWAGKEYQVATLQLITTDGRITCILVS